MDISSLINLKLVEVTGLNALSIPDLSAQARGYLRRIRASALHAQDVPLDGDDLIASSIDELVRCVDNMLLRSDDPFEDYAIIRCALSRIQSANEYGTAVERMPNWSRICLRVGAFTDAMRIADLYISLASDSPNDAGIIEVLRYRAKAQRNLGDFIGSEHTYRRLIQLASRAPEPVDLSVGLLLLGKLHGNYRGQHSLFYAFVQEARSRLEVQRKRATYPNPERLIRYLAVCYDSLGQAFRTGEPRRARRFFSIAIQLSRLIGRENVGLRSRCHFIQLQFGLASQSGKRRLLKEFEKEIKRLQSDSHEEGGLAIRWLQYANMLHALDEPRPAHLYIQEAKTLARRYNAHRVFVRAVVAEFDFFSVQDQDSALQSLLEGRRVAVEDHLALQESEINLRLANCRAYPPRAFPSALDLMERNHQIHGEIIEHARQGLIALEQPSEGHPEFHLLSRKTRELFRRNLLIDYEQAVRRLDQNLMGMKALLHMSERRRQEAVVLGISNSLARALLHEVKLNLDEKTGRSPVVNTASGLRETAKFMAHVAAQSHAQAQQFEGVVRRLTEYAGRLEHFDDELGRLKQLLIGRLRRITSLDERVSIRAAAEVAIQELQARDPKLSDLSDVRSDIDIEVVFERELMITVIQTLLVNAIQARQRYAFTNAHIGLHLFARPISMPDVPFTIAEPVMHVATWGLNATQAKSVHEEIANGLRGEAVSTPSSTGFGLELADTVFVQQMGGALTPFSTETEAGLEVLFNTNAKRARMVPVQ
jgi:hypothetical protein